MQVAMMLTSGVCASCGERFQSTNPDARVCMVCAYDQPQGPARASEVTIGVCDCDDCGAKYDFETSGADHTDQCPSCQAIEEARESAAEAHQDAIDTAEGERDEAADDVERLEAEMAELRAELTEAKARKRAAERALAKLAS
jgi:ssDNA-binding Zn-finger/Zn-ribbon topoisomerase 1